jgi:hypothetical protein
MNNFFSNLKFNQDIYSNSINLISCDDHYWKKYGIFNVISCNETNQDIHVHIINPSPETIKSLKKLKEQCHINITQSSESFETTELNFYFLKSYYYMSRFFISRFIFNNTTVQEIKITDADIFFNEFIEFPNNINLAVSYRPNNNTAWERTAAYFLYVTKEYSNFLNLVVEVYQKKVKNIDFYKIEKIENKIEKANNTGLDQVCLTEVLEDQKIFQNADFLNLDSLLDFSSKGENDSKIWVLVGKTKRSLEDSYLYSKYKNYFKEEQQ